MFRRWQLSKDRGERREWGYLGEEGAGWRDSKCKSMYKTARRPVAGAERERGESGLLYFLCLMRW